MIRLALAGVDSLLLSPLCAMCPQGRAGCCAAPPAIAWVDIGRILHLGGREFLREEMQAGRLVPNVRGLGILRVDSNVDFPERCVYLGREGCVLAPSRRSTTCNYYLCDDSYELATSEGDPSVDRARRAQARITELLGAWDIELSERVKEKFPDGVPWDDAFFDWVLAEFERLVQRSSEQLRAIGMS